MSIFSNYQFFMDMCNRAVKDNPWGSGMMDTIRFQFEEEDYELRFDYKDTNNSPQSYRVGISLSRHREYVTRYLFELKMNYGWTITDKFFVPAKIDMVLETSVPVEEIETILTYMKLTL